MIPPRLQAFLAIVFWGLSFVATRIALRELSPVTLIFTRFGLGLLPLYAILIARRQPLLPARREWPVLALLGFIAVFVHQLLQANALRFTSAVSTGWLIGLTPIWSAALAALFLRERFTALQGLGLAVGAIGAAILVTRGRFDAARFALPATRGDLLILASTFNWAIYTTLGRGPMQRIGSLRATPAVMLVGWLMIAPLFAIESGWREWPGLSGGAIGAVLFLGLGCSGIAYLFWNGALERIPAGSVASFLYLEPLVTVAAAVPLLGEEVGRATLVGGVLVLAGVWIVQRAQRS